MMSNRIIINKISIVVSYPAANTNKAIPNKIIGTEGSLRVIKAPIAQPKQPTIINSNIMVKRLPKRSKLFMWT
jgi:hypothetical protein